MNEQEYATLFIDLADYRLPDGTEVQAIWTGSEQDPDHHTPPYWILAHHDNPHDKQSPRLQYEARRDRSIIAVQWRPGEHIFAPVKYEQEGYSDLSRDDFELIRNPWESINQ